MKFRETMKRPSLRIIEIEEKNPSSKLIEHINKIIEEKISNL